MNSFFDYLEIIQSSPTNDFINPIRHGSSIQKDNWRSLLSPRCSCKASVIVNSVSVSYVNFIC